MNDSPSRGQARVLPAGAGFHWLACSLRLVRTQPARLLLLTVLMQAVLGLSQLPLIGLLVVIAMPALTAGLLEAFRQVDTGRMPPFSVLFVPLATRGRLGRFLALGVLMVATGVITVTAMVGTGGGLDPDLIARIEQGDVDAIAALDPEFVFRMAMALLVAVGVTGTLSFLSIPLIWFGDRPVGGSLGAGLRAMLVNWKAFGALALGLAALVVPVAIVVGAVYGGGTPGGGSLFVLALVMLAMLLFQLVIFGTQYCAYRDLFGLPDREAGGPSLENDAGGDDDGQLVA